MRWPIIMSILLAGCVHTQPEPADYSLQNGLWYRDGAFTQQTAYVRNGVLRFSDRAVRAERTIDLAGGYVVPPFCEAHNHNLGGSAENVYEVSDAYLRTGVFYALMPGSFALYRKQIQDRLDTPRSVDVLFANNGLTGPGGHPRGLRESLQERFGLYPEFSKEELADTGYFEASDRAEVVAKMEMIKVEAPDMIKVMLFFSEEYDARRSDPAFYGKRGLDPALLPLVVELAHAENLRVIVHVESEADMVTAIDADADMIAHLPSYDAPIRLSDETVRLAAANPETALVTTFSLAKRVEQREPETYAAIIEAQRDNLRRLVAAGARIVVGSDNTQDTSLLETAHLASLGVLENATLLEMWTEKCARSLYPDRNIGRLADGSEASFLVLGGDPLEDFENTRDIRIRMKDGLLLGEFR